MDINVFYIYGIFQFEVLGFDIKNIRNHYLEGNTEKEKKKQKRGTFDNKFNSIK